MKDLLSKFLSRKFVAALALFIVSALAVFNVDSEIVKTIASVGTILAPMFYILVEGYLDGKSIKLGAVVPTMATAVANLIQVYEDNYGENDISNFVQDLAALFSKYSVEQVASGEVVVESTEVK